MTENEARQPPEPDGEPDQDERAQREAQGEDPTSPLRGFDDAESAEAPQDDAPES